MNSTEIKFNTRAFVAAGALFSGVGLPVTGLANHFYGFAPMSVARHAWMTAHNALGLMFVVFALWHISINRRALWNHVRGAGARVPHFSREAALAGLAVAILLLLLTSHAFLAGEPS